MESITGNTKKSRMQSWVINMVSDAWTSNSKHSSRLQKVESFSFAPIHRKEVKTLCQKMDLLADRTDDSLFVHADEMAEVLRLLRSFHVPYSDKVKEALYAGRIVPDGSLTDIGNTLTFLVSSDSPVEKTGKEKLTGILKKNGVIEKGKVSLVMSQDIRKLLLSSAGKMASIEIKCDPAPV